MLDRFSTDSVLSAAQKPISLLLAQTMLVLVEGRVYLFREIHKAPGREPEDLRVF